MKWSWKLGRVFGIDVFVHASFLLLIAWLILTSYWDSGDLTSAMMGSLFTIALFVCIILHEFGHALAARRFGIATRDVTVLPIGGLARLERIPEEPRQELAVALAGPLVNLVIAIALYGFLHATGAYQPPFGNGFSDAPFLERLMVSNLFLVGFNLLPAFPMDGGRVLRALLATRFEYGRSTRVAAMLGQTMALFFGVSGVMGNPVLILIAVFVWIGAA